MNYRPRHRHGDPRAEKPLVPPAVPVAAAIASAALIALRLAGVVGWAWPWLLSPLWGLGAALLAGVYLTVAAELLPRRRADAP
jgi:fatty acid desaturase